MRKKGFTLIELVIVLIILGVLATLGITYYGGLKEKFKAVEAVNFLTAVRSAQLRYITEAGVTTDSLDKLGITADLTYFSSSSVVLTKDLTLADKTSEVANIKRDITKDGAVSLSNYTLSITLGGSITCNCVGCSDASCSKAGY